MITASPLVPASPTVPAAPTPPWELLKSSRLAQVDYGNFYVTESFSTHS